MTEEEKDTRCTYERVDGDRCDHPVLEGKGRCLFHAKTKDDAECTKALLGRLDAGNGDMEGFQLPALDLSGRVFHGDVSLRNAVVTGRTSLAGATLPEHTDLRGATFEGDVDMSKASFSGPVTFEGVRFKADATFEDAVFGSDTEFAKARFEGEAVFAYATFRDVVRFEEARFGPRADFHHTVFRNDVHFDDVHVEGRAYLAFAEFGRTSFFMEMACEGEADFSFAEFTNYADFTMSSWKHLDMTDVLFVKRGCFDQATIASGTFEDAELRHVTFRDVDLSNVLTTGASLEEAYMSQARWGEPEWGPFGKKLHVREEALAEAEGTREALRRAESAHRNLKESYKNEGDYETAGEFFIREMAMKRRAAWMERKYAYWFMGNVISGLCGYGERPTRVIFWWFAFTFTFAVVYFTGRLIEYSDGVTEIDFSTLGGFLTCLYFSVVTFTTLGFGDISPVTDAGRAIASVEAFTGAFMIALFVLVFGRKMIR